MRCSHFSKVLTFLATSFLATASAESSADCPARVLLVLNKQQSHEYIDSPKFTLSKHVISNNAGQAANVERYKSSCDAQYLDLSQVSDLKQGASYIISGTEGSIDKALEHIQNIVKDYTVVLDSKAHLQKRQQEVTPTKPDETAPSNSGPSIPGPSTNPGKNESRTDQLRSKFWTIGLLTGLLTTFIMVLILLVGICWLASIEGPTRFESVKQKRS
ncbi:hypothetical protein K493DRAFT_318524 [Basidiobolus meristosporus CBS 931.73]|uniref:V-type proton ATPase subunit S1/VOA1 transmembrane domain-containing protein n=1 Tax=Basidiobolus meristosporus CBS 931.73 TaxID=1314790 RepID=A0A1Y1XWE7_9FUNG|nr:hypothetical protein K493DRAFT_318524 [Basidiobolus meristosporus CBS 931.73]|eukprot:ORX89654.1 hypothetical protein K493DRAFT_318524 [Basidiobolus meristosporus CBS 931.73]